MKSYEVRVVQRRTSDCEAWIRVDASSEDEAIRLAESEANENPGNYEWDEICYDYNCDAEAVEVCESGEKQ